MYLEDPFVVDVSEVHLTYHMSWNGVDHADADMDDDLVSMDSLFSIPNR
jgi:hypothetical protein